MAFSVTILCLACGKNKEVMVASGDPLPSICDSCKYNIENRKKQKHLVKLKRMTLEERIAKLKEQAYSHTNVPHGYQSPPRY